MLQSFVLIIFVYVRHTVPQSVGLGQFSHGKVKETLFFFSFLVLVLPQILMKAMTLNMVSLMSLCSQSCICCLVLFFPTLKLLYHFNSLYLTVCRTRLTVAKCELFSGWLVYPSICYMSGTCDKADQNGIMSADSELFWGILAVKLFMIGSIALHFTKLFCLL